MNPSRSTSPSPSAPTLTSASAEAPAQLSATVSTAAVRRLQGRRQRTARPQLGRLASVLVLLALGCGLAGFALLVRDFSEASFSPWVAAWGVGTAALVWASSTWLGRSAPGALVGLLGVAAAAYTLRDELGQQVASAWEAITSWTLATSDYTLLAAFGFALLGILVGVAVFAWHAGWALSLAALGVLCACPSEAIEPSVLGIALLVLYTAAVLAEGFVGRLFDRRTSLVAVSLGIAALAVAVAVPLATHAPDALSAPVRFLNDAVDRMATLLPGGAERAEQRAAANASAALGGSGIVNRGNLDAPGAQTLVDVTLSQAPSQTLYLPHFHGGLYSAGRWEAAVEPAELRVSGAAIVLLQYAAGTNPIDTAAFFAASARVGDGGDPVVAAIDAHSTALDAAALRPYASMAITAPEDSASATTRYFGLVPLGTYGSLCAAGVVDPWLAPGQTTEPAVSYGDNPLLEGAQAILNAYLPDAYARFLEVPYEELPRLSELVAANPCATVGEAVAFVQETLATNATYTTTPGTFPADVDIAEYLLFEGHAGYCQQFATAATLMLRMYGIPARYVTGLAAPASAFNASDEGWHATLGVARAHAWVEIYTDQLGWVPVEATPSSAQDSAPFSDSDPANASHNEPPAFPAEAEPEPEDGKENPAEPQADSESSEDAGSGNDGDSEEQDASSTAETTPESDNASESEDDASANPLASVPWGLLAALALVLAVAGAVVRGIRQRRERLLEQRAHATAEGLLAETVEVLHFGGLMADWNGTEDAFAAELSRAVPAVREPQARRFVEQALEAAFGANQLPQAAGPEERAVYDAVCTAVYDGLGSWRRAVFTWVRAFR